jgi:hypothetical protein
VVTTRKSSCSLCRKRPVYCKRQCRRCYSRNWARQKRASYPIAECTACHRNRPIQRQDEGWCESCVTRWQDAGRPRTGPPPLLTREEILQIRRAAVRERLARAREVDEIAVERAVLADRPQRLTTGEREQVVKRLHRLRMTDRQIAEHLDIGPTGVQTIRHRLGLPAVTTLTRRQAVAA